MSVQLRSGRKDIHDHWDALKTARGDPEEWTQSAGSRADAQEGE